MSRFLEQMVLLALEWPELFGEALFGYIARRGAWHLSSRGHRAMAVQFLDRLLLHPDREALMSAERWAGALTEGLGTLADATSDEGGRIDEAALVRLLLSSQDRRMLRSGCRFLANLDLPRLESAFADTPNPSATAPILLAEELARRVLARDDRELWKAIGRRSVAGYEALLAAPFEWRPTETDGAEEDGSSIQQVALHAYRHSAYARPEWVAVDDLERMVACGPYGRMLLTFFALQGNALALRFTDDMFWNPRWDYNREEIRLLRGALLFRGALSCENAADEGVRAAYRAVEERRQALLDDERTTLVARQVLDVYWRLPVAMDVLERLRLREVPNGPGLAWLLLSSPFWEVCEQTASMLAHAAAGDEQWLTTLVEWAASEGAEGRGVGDLNPVLGAAMALRQHAEQTGRLDAFSRALRAQVSSRSAQVRGHCANALQTLISNATPVRRSELLAEFRAPLRCLLHGSDAWEVNEVLILGEALEGVGVGWENEWDAHEAPLLKRMPDWREVGALAFGDVLTARLEAQSRLRAST